MTDQHHLLRAIRDVARMIEKDEPVVADAALAHLVAGTIARMADKEEYLNPDLRPVSQCYGGVGSVGIDIAGAWAATGAGRRLGARPARGLARSTFQIKPMTRRHATRRRLLSPLDVLVLKLRRLCFKTRYRESEGSLSNWSSLLQSQPAAHGMRRFPTRIVIPSARCRPNVTLITILPTLAMR